MMGENWLIVDGSRPIETAKMVKAPVIAFDCAVQGKGQAQWR